MLLLLIVLKIRNLLPVVDTVVCHLHLASGPRHSFSQLQSWLMAHRELPSAEGSFLAQSHTPSQRTPCIQWQMWREKGLVLCFWENNPEELFQWGGWGFAVTVSQFKFSRCHLCFLAPPTSPTHDGPEEVYWVMSSGEYKQICLRVCFPRSSSKILLNTMWFTLSCGRSDTVLKKGRRHSSKMSLLQPKMISLKQL